MNTRLLFLVFFLFLFTLQKGYSQDAIEHPQLPNPSPQSPNAFEFTKYGEVNVNESTGVISPSIPIYTYSAGGITIPLTLNYSGNGVRVAQDPTWVGINWNFTPGGVITRQVRDLADEKVNSADKKYLSSTNINALPDPWDWDNTSSGSWFNTLYNIGNASGIDSEVDIFNYNFLGYSGSFYLEKDPSINNPSPFLKVFEGVLIKYDKEIKIEFHYTDNLYNKNTIQVTTPDGTIYYFGGANASESSKTFVNNGAGSTSINNPFVQNAFYLYQISTSNGDSVTFNYEQKNDLSFHNFLIGKQESLKNWVDCEPSGCSQPTSFTPYDKRDLSIVVESAVFLSSITSLISDIKVEFSSTSFERPGEFGYWRMKKLNFIYVKDDAGNIIKDVNLTYDPNSAGDKFFLEEVKFRDDNPLNEIYNYRLDYDNLSSVPSFKSYARDFNGFFNGEIGNGNMDLTNSSLLPTPSTTFIGFSNFANRDVDFTNMKKGSLTKITYPTGGHSDFEYEIPTGTDYPKLRIKKITTDTGGLEHNEVIKRYWYNERSIYNIGDQRTYVSTPKYEYTTKTRVIIGGLLIDTHEYKHLTANALNNVYNNDSGSILYPYVTVSYGGDSFEQGGKESKYKTNTQGSPQDYLYADNVPSSYTANFNTLKNSVLERERYFKGTNPSSIKEVHYDYAVTPEILDYVNNIKINRLVSGDGPHEISDFQFGLYKIHSNQYILRKKTTLNQGLTTIETYKYDDYIGLPSSVKTTTSVIEDETASTKVNTEKETKYYYPTSSLPVTTGLSASEINDIQSLVGIHKVSQPYLVQNYDDNNQLLSSNLTAYSDQLSSSSVPLASVIRTGKIDQAGNIAYSDRITYTEYYGTGRPKIVSFKDGSKVYYEYNINRQVILKVENYDSANIDNTVSTEDPCYNQKKYPGALVTVYNYDTDNENLISIQDVKCSKTFFEYDSFNRLARIKDLNGKVLSEYKYHYKGH